MSPPNLPHASPSVIPNHQFPTLNQNFPSVVTARQFPTLGQGLEETAIHVGKTEKTAPQAFQPQSRRGPNAMGRFAALDDEADDMEEQGKVIRAAHVQKVGILMIDDGLMIW